MLLLALPVVACWQLAHLTDIHWDPYYQVGSHADCLFGDWLGSKCCRSFSVPRLNGNPRKAGRWGDQNCDTNIELLNLTLASLSALDDVSAILYTGDSNSHLDYFETPSTVRDTIITIANLFQHYLKVPVYNSLGNHESWPIDNLDDEYWNFLSQTVRYAWNQSLSTDSISTLVRGGYYKEEVTPGLILISIQTIWYDPYNFLERLTHPFSNRANQSKWLRNSLQEIKAAGKKALIVGHAAPCSYEAGSFTETLRELIRDYQDVIVAGLFGHEHYDTFRWLAPDNKVAMDKTDASGLPIIITPSVIPEMNPRYRVITFNDVTFEIEEIVTYYLNLTEANKDSLTIPSYQRLYSYRDQYGLEQVTSKTIRQLIDRLTQNHTLQLEYQWLRRTPDQRTGFQYDDPVLTC